MNMELSDKRRELRSQDVVGLKINDVGTRIDEATKDRKVRLLKQR